MQLTTPPQVAPMDAQSTIWVKHPIPVSSPAALRSKCHLERRSVVWDSRRPSSQVAGVLFCLGEGSRTPHSDPRDFARSCHVRYSECRAIHESIAVHRDGWTAILFWEAKALLNWQHAVASRTCLESPRAPAACLAPPRRTRAPPQCLARARLEEPSRNSASLQPPAIRLSCVVMFAPTETPRKTSPRRAVSRGITTRTAPTPWRASWRAADKEKRRSLEAIDQEAPSPNEL